MKKWKRLLLFSHSDQVQFFERERESPLPVYKKLPMATLFIIVPNDFWHEKLIFASVFNRCNGPEGRLMANTI